MISFSSRGSFDNTERFLNAIIHGHIFSTLAHYGDEGVAALSAATPVDSGETANAWFYEILQDETSYSIIWGNSHVNEGRQIAVLIQYGHGTGTGGFVEGRDYMNPALQPIFDRIADEAWRAVISA